MTQDLRKPLLVLAGPTAVGKTGISLMLARAVHGEIISADSMQVYRTLDIGTAKILPEEQEGIPHHLIDVLDPSEDFHVARFQEMARAAMETIYAAGHIPIMTGGTGFYLQAITRDIDFTEEEGSQELRNAWERLAKEEGPEVLHGHLQEVDPVAAAAIHPHNVRRVIRALEYQARVQEPISQHNAKQREKKTPYNLAYFVLTEDRSVLYQKINARVDAMLDAGLEEEARRLYDLHLAPTHTAAKAIGYKEFFSYFRGEYDREEAIRLIKQNTRHYAKRQWTWFKREDDAIWIDRADFADEAAIVDYMLQEIRARGICLPGDGA